MCCVVLRAFAFFIVASLASTSWAGYGRGMGGGGGGGGGRSSAPSPPPAPPPPPIDRSASTKARQEVQLATAEMERANAALTSITEQLRKAKLEPTTAWKAAEAALSAAQKQFDTARDAAMKALKSDPGYQGALAERAKAQADHDALQSTTPIEERYRVANAMVSTAQLITSLETAAVTNNPVAAKAKAELDAARAVAASLQAGFDSTLVGDPTWSTVAKAVEDRKQRLADAKKTLTDALANEAQMARDRQKQIATNH